MCIQMDVDVCSHSVPALIVVGISLCDNSTWYHKGLMCVVYCLGAGIGPVIFGTTVCVCVCACVRACMCVRECVCACPNTKIKPTSYFIICCKTYIRKYILSSCYNEIPDITVVLDSSECLTIGRCLNLL